MSSFGAPRENKFYTGSKHSNTWVKDLLWRRYCLREGEALGVKSLKPPLMAMHKGEFAMDDQKDHPLGGRRRKLGTPGSLSRSGRNLASGSAKEVERLKKLLQQANDRAQNAEKRALIAEEKARKADAYALKCARLVKKLRTAKNDYA
jgi:hypothetical protein